MSNTLHGTVIKNHVTSYPTPIVCNVGEILQIIKEDEKWNGWVWCRNEIGIEGWVPKNYLHVNGNLGTVTNDYNSYELTVHIGEEVTITCEESGWFLCINSDNQVGWVPCECIQIRK
jgi:hypothetical protein